MANYKNGLETKESLYQSAKKIFYQKGYDKTTVKDIITVLCGGFKTAAVCKKHAGSAGLFL